MPGSSNGNSSCKEIRDAIEKHPEFFDRILARSAGSMGELLVADRLSGLGYRVEPNSPGAQQSDILAQTSSEKKFEVEVKTVSKRSYYWFSKRPVTGRADYWILVCLNRENNMLPEMDRVEFFVLTTEEAQRVGAPLQRHAADGRGRRRHRGGRGHRHRHRPGRHGDRLMSESARHTIPRRLDDPERWLFWTVDEAAALMGPALLGLAANQFVPGLIAGVGGWLVLRRVKRGGGANIARYALYWFLPDFVLRLKATPPSHLRRFVG